MTPPTALNRLPALQALLAAWVERGWLRALDQAFVKFLLDQAPDCPPLVLLAAALASHQLGRGHVCLDLAATLAAPDLALSLPPEGEEDREGDGAAPPLPSAALRGLTVGDWHEQLAAAAGLVARRPAAIAEDDDGAPCRPLVLAGDAARPRLYLYRYWRHEQQVARGLLALLARETPPPEGLAAALDQLFPAAAARPDWQKIACALATRSALTLVTGGPGTGKTTTVIRLLALLQDGALRQGRTLRIRLAAPTGKAAARLTASIADQIAALPVDEAVRRAIPAEVSTVHRLLGSRPDTRHFVHHRDNPLPLDVLVVDEASMIDLEMMSCLLAALPERARLVLLGDKDQLASVEAGAVLGDLCHGAELGRYTPETAAWIGAHCGEDLAGQGLQPGEAARHPLAQQTVMLRHSRRFHAGSGIGQLARAINGGDGPACRRLFGAGLPDLAHLPLQDERDPAFDRLFLAGYGPYLELLAQERPSAAARLADPAWNDWALRVLAAFGQFQLLCALRRGPWGVEGLNPRIAAALRSAGRLGAGDGWYEGRPILVTHNDYGLGVMNGDIGVALRVPVSGARHELRVAIPHPEDSRRVRFLHPSRLTAVHTAFAMTVHKSQGSEFTHAALVLPDRLNPVLTRELIYTAVTRARERFTLAEPGGQVFEAAVERRVQRESGLVDLLWAGGENSD